MSAHVLTEWLLSGDLVSAEEDGVLELLVAAGALTAPEAQQWRRAIRRVARRDRGAPDMLELLDGLQERSPAPTEAPWLESDPIRTIVLAPDDVHAGIRLTSVVCRARTTEVRWRGAGAAAGGIDLTLADDLSTLYGSGWTGGAQSRGSGPDRISSGMHVFRAAVPENARELTLTWGGATSTCDPGAPWPGS